MFDSDEILFMIEATKGVKCRPDELASVFWNWLPRSSDILDKVQPIAFINKVHDLNPSDLARLHSQLEEYWAVQSIPDVAGTPKSNGQTDLLHAGRAHPSFLQRREEVV